MQINITPSLRSHQTVVIVSLYEYTLRFRGTQLHGNVDALSKLSFSVKLSTSEPPCRSKFYIRMLFLRILYYMRVRMNCGLLITIMTSHVHVHTQHTHIYTPTNPKKGGKEKKVRKCKKSRKGKKTWVINIKAEHTYSHLNTPAAQPSS